MLHSSGEQNEVTVLNQKPIAYTYSASSDTDITGIIQIMHMKNSPLKRIIILPR